MKKSVLLSLFAIGISAAVAVGCWYRHKSNNGKQITGVETVSQVEEVAAENLDVKGVAGKVAIVDTFGLRIYRPDYTRMDLVCGDMPKKEDKQVILFVEAAFTGDLLDEFAHSNIAGDHVSGGEYFKGYSCKRNNGAFVYYDGRPKFLHGDYSSEMRKAAERGGCAVAQEMMIHEGREVKHTRPADNTNEFRALCMIDGKVAVADSRGMMAFGDFIKNLKKAGATEALYMDMGGGWNYSFFRDENGWPVEIHPYPTEYATNWITFYSEN